MIATPIEHAPALLDVHRRAPDRWPYLLSSSAHSGALGRWSLLLRRSDAALILGDASMPFAERFRQRAVVEAQPPSAGPALPFWGGWFVYLGYEWAGELEPSLHLPKPADALPTAMAAHCSAAMIVDHQTGGVWLAAESASAQAEAHNELMTIQEALKSVKDAFNEDVSWLETLQLSSDAPEQFMNGVRQIQDYILAGDVFQVNLSRRWWGTAAGRIDPISVYQRLMRSNPAPFAGLAKLPGGTLISSSPERLVSLRDGCVQTRPIAGTRPRGQGARADEALSNELINNIKERAEHIMLIDLERNDLGRVCQPGSVKVDELMVVESYEHVHHIVSNVRGQLAAGLDAIDVLAAVFPGGTITGCPKVRCMQIIAELEGVGRSFYTGAMGYVGHGQELDFNILIRTLCVHDARGQSSLSFRTGAGIVADSVPESELAETITKAEGLVRALR